MKGAVTRMLALAGLWLVLSAAPVVVAQTQNGPDALLKAVFIYNFAKFTEWPKETWVSDNSPLIFCVVGTDELADELGQLGGKPIHGRSVIVRRLNGEQISERCNVLYVADLPEERLDSLIRSIGDRPILTVSQQAKFVKAGGVIQLYREDGRIRFIVNLAAARSAGLTISSRLLRLAVVLGHEGAQ